MEVTLKGQPQPFCVSAQMGNTLSAVRTWHRDFAAGDTALCAILKPLTW